MHKMPIKRERALSFVFALVSILLVSVAAYSSVVEVTAIGKIESKYRDRVTMRIIKLVGSDTVSLPVSEGSWVSYDLPRHEGKRGNRRTNINFGDIVQAQLIGNITTEYEVNDDGTSAGTSEKLSPVMLWTAQSVVKVKKPGQYLTEEEKQAKKGRRGRRSRKKEEKPKEPVKIWTQEETVRGIVNLRAKEKRLYIKEDRMGRKDKGLDVIDDVWYEKLKDLNGHKVVVHGITHRTSISSGTVEIKNILKIYPK
ncbi:MAG: hypothetical protein Kow0029_07230 [Candidatus Rifleibacteriota bacterium]